MPFDGLASRFHDRRSSRPSWGLVPAWERVAWLVAAISVAAFIDPLTRGVVAFFSALLGVESP